MTDDILLKKLKTLEKTGVSFNENDYHPPFVLENVITSEKCEYQYLVVDHSYVYFFRVLWKTLENDLVICRKVEFHRDNTTVCDGGIIVYYKKDVQRFYVTAKSIKGVSGTYSIKGYRKQHHHHPQKERRKEPRIDENCVFFQVRKDSRRRYGVPVTKIRDSPFLMKLVEKKILKERLKMKKELEKKKFEETLDQGPQSINPVVSSKHVVDHTVYLTNHQDIETFDLIRQKIFSGKMESTTDYFFEQYAKENVVDKLYYHVTGYVNCFLILLEHNNMFFYYREGLKKIKLITIVQYDVEGSVEISTRIGNFLFFHEKCKMFFNKKYRKCIQLKELESIQFR